MAQVTTRAEMPEWAKAKAASRPNPELKAAFDKLRIKLFGKDAA